MITYNHAKYIKKAIQGVLKQSVDFPLELIVADDCSNDETIDIILDEISCNTSNVEIILLKNKKNIGVNRNFVAALYACSGDFIAICEGDDYWIDDNKLQIQFDFLANQPEFVMSFHDGNVLKEDVLLEQSILNQSTKRDLSYGDLVYGFYTIPTLTVFFKNIIRYKLPQEFFEITNCDSFLFLFLSQYGRIHFHRNICNVVHVHHQGGIWSMKNSLEKSLKSYNSYFKAYSFFKDKRLIIPLVNFGNSVIINSFKSKNYVLAFKFYLLNISNSMRYFPAWKYFFNKQLDFLTRR